MAYQVNYGYKEQCNHCGEFYLIYPDIYGRVTRCPWCSYFIKVSLFDGDMHYYPHTWKEKVTRLPYYKGDEE